MDNSIYHRAYKALSEYTLLTHDALQKDYCPVFALEGEKNDNA